MTRTQIQLPDEIYARARRVCADREISFAEFARRGIEYMLSVYPPAAGTGTKVWEPPTSAGLNLSWSGLSESEIKDLAQATESEKLR